MRRYTLVTATVMFAAACAAIEYPSALATGTIDLDALSVAPDHLCAALEDGTPVCWGANDAAQLGVPRSNVPSAPVTPDLGPLVLRGAVAGLGATCATDLEQRVWCWGGNNPVPRKADEGHALSDLRGGAFFCGREDAGGLVCWDSVATAAVSIAGSAGFWTYDVEGFACGLGADSLAQCWDANNGPTLVPGGVKFRSIDVGSTHACGIGADGVPRCWGSNDYGQLGTNNTTPSATPVAVLPTVSGAGLKSISAGETHSCAADSLGHGYCWGRAGGGALGVGYFPGIEAVTYPRPVQVSLILSFLTAPSARGNLSCARTAAGAIYCWGQNASGQFATGDTATAWAPVQVAPPPLAVTEPRQ